MKDIVNRYIDRFQKNHRHFRRYIIFVGVLAIVTIIGVNWGLHQEGISMTDEYVCGYQEHQHTDDCYQNELICGQEENDEHQHSEECYEKTLICTLPEHIHTDSCKKQVGVSTIAVYTSNSMNDNGNVTAISGEGTKYDENSNIYSSKLKINFSFTADAVSSNQSYYYEYPEGIIIPDALLNKTYTLYDSQNKKAGTYHFEKTDDGKYRVVIDFEEGYVTIENDDITGYIEFAGQIDASKADDNGNIEIFGSDEVNLVIPKEQITYPEDATNRYEIKTKKAGSYSTKDGKLVYTVTVSSVKGTPGDIDFKDIIEANGLKLSDPNVKVTQETITRYYNNNGYYDAVTGSTTLDNVNYQYENGNLTMTLPKIEVKNDENTLVYTRYTITYTYDVNDIEGASVLANNKVTTDSKNENVEVKSDSTVEVTINNVHTINKSGWYDSSNGEIEWTITVNKNNLDITNAKLTDNMLSKLAEGTNVNISPSNDGYKIEKDENGKITGITFTALEDDKNTDTYTIKYRTKADRKWNKETVTNEAKFTPSDGKGIPGTGTVDVPGGNVNKKYTEATESKDGKTAEVGWKITVDVPSSLPKDTVIKDDPTQDQYGGSGGKQYLTHQQEIEWANGIYWTDGDGNKVGDNLDLTNLADISFKASDGNEYTWDEIKSSNSNDLTFTVWNVKLKNDLDVPEGAQKLIFDYKTTADLEDADMGTTYYNNTVTIGDKKDDARYGYEKCGVIKTDENGRKETTTKTNADGTLVWKIKTHINKETGKLTFVDDLPEDIKLVSIAGRDYLNNLTNIIIQDDGTINGTDGYYKVSGKYEDNKVTLDVAPSSTGNKLSNGDYTIVLTCKVNKDNINNYESGKTYTFKNSTTVSNDEGNIGSADQSQKWTEDTSHEESKVIDKTGKWDNNSRRVKYSISLNPDGKDIVEDSEILTLKDVFKYYSIVYCLQENGGSAKEIYNVTARLIPDSVKLYQGIKQADGTLKKGEEIKSWAWTLEEKTDEYPNYGGGYYQYSILSGQNLPDSTAMILEYDYQIETDIPDGWRSENSLDITNSAELSGTAYRDDKPQNDTVWKKQESSGAVTTDIKGILYKVSQGNYGKTLPGAIFKLQKYNGGQFEDTGITYTTDNGGKITIKYQKSNSDTKYDYNVLYRVVEKSAPNDYIISENPDENAFYFYFSSDTDTNYTLPSNLNELAPKAADLSKASTTFYVENESCNTELTINKKWFDAQGNVEVGHSGTVRVELYRRTSKYPPSMGNIAKISGSIDNGGTKVKQFTEENYRVGSVVKLTVTCRNKSEGTVPKAPTIKLNDKEIVAETTTDGEKTIYTYTFTLVNLENVIKGYTHLWDDDQYMTISDLDVTDSTTEILYDTYEITSSDNWSKVISDLPAISINKAGERVYYTYYVKELGNSNYDVSYDNNEGINFGTITIKNKMSENPSYVLPETGSFGEVIVALGGLIMMIVAVIYYLKNKKIEGKGRKI